MHLLAYFFCLGVLWTVFSVCTQLLSCVWLFVTPWTVAHQVPLSMDFPGKSTEWVATSFLGHLSNPGIKPVSPALAGGFSTTEPPRKPLNWIVWGLFCNFIKHVFLESLILVSWPLLRPAVPSRTPPWTPDKIWPLSLSCLPKPQKEVLLLNNS